MNDEVPVAKQIEALEGLIQNGENAGLEWWSVYGVYGGPVECDDLTSALIWEGLELLLKAKKEGK